MVATPNHFNKPMTRVIQMPCILFTHPYIHTHTHTHTVTHSHTFRMMLELCCQLAEPSQVTWRQESSVSVKCLQEHGLWVPRTSNMMKCVSVNPTYGLCMQNVKQTIVDMLWPTKIFPVKPWVLICEVISSKFLVYQHCEAAVAAAVVLIRSVLNINL